MWEKLKSLMSEALGLENLSDDWRVNPNLPVPPEPDPGETANDAQCAEEEALRRAA